MIATLTIPQGAKVAFGIGNRCSRATVLNFKRAPAKEL
jgi:hypothetical protein